MYIIYRDRKLILDTQWHIPVIAGITTFTVGNSLLINSLLLNTSQLADWKMPSIWNLGMLLQAANVFWLISDSLKLLWILPDI